MKGIRARYGRAGLACCLAWFAAACSEADSGRTPPNGADVGAFAVRDSAGIAIIESAAESNIVSIVEVLRIGGVEGDPPYELYRVGDVAIDPPGHIYVASANGIRVFAQRGRFVRRFGEAGKGPTAARTNRAVDPRRTAALGAFADRRHPMGAPSLSNARTI